MAQVKITFTQEIPKDSELDENERKRLEEIGKLFGAEKAITSAALVAEGGGRLPKVDRKVDESASVSIEVKGERKPKAAKAAPAPKQGKGK